MSKTARIYIDIETMAGEKPRLDSFTADGRLKDPVKIEEDLMKKQDKAWRAQPLNPFQGEVFCIGMAVEDEPAFCITGTDERETLSIFASEMKQHPYPIIYGHNLLEFDAYFLFIRALKYGMGSLVSVFSGKGGGVRLEDTMRAMDGPAWKKMASLDKMAKHLEFDGKGDITGADVHDLILNGEGDRVCKYCISDVEILRNCVKKLRECGLSI